MHIYFITGVSRGLGQSLSEALASDDSILIGFGRTKGDFAGEFHTCDFTKPQLAASILDSAFASAPLEQAASITFIANAGSLGPITQAQNLDAFDIEHTVSANLAGSAVSASTFLKHVASLPVPKRFIQISSGAALPDRAKGSWSLYCASKAGQEQLVRAIAVEQETAPHPTAFININPGVMETAMQATIRGLSPEQFPEVGKFIKLKEDGKVPSPETIAQKIKTLLSEPSSLENGQTYNLAAY